MDTEAIFLRYSADKLEQLSGRIATCLDQLTTEQIWMRGADSNNAVGNLVLHLCGNIRQWIGTGIGGLAPVRDRDAEFAARGGLSGGELRTLLERNVREMAAILRNLETEGLSQIVQIQGYTVTVLEAAYHVVEHFAGHAGQIVFATKLMTGGDLGFYRHIGQTAHGETVP